MKQNKGIAQIFVIAIMLALAVALPLTTKLVQQNQENRSKAATGCIYSTPTTTGCKLGVAFKCVNSADQAITLNPGVVVCRGDEWIGDDLACTSKSTSTSTSTCETSCTGGTPTSGLCRSKTSFVGKTCCTKTVATPPKTCADFGAGTTCENDVNSCMGLGRPVKGPYGDCVLPKVCCGPKTAATTKWKITGACVNGNWTCTDGTDSSYNFPDQASCASSTGCEPGGTGGGTPTTCAAAGGSCFAPEGTVNTCAGFTTKYATINGSVYTSKNGTCTTTGAVCCAKVAGVCTTGQQRCSTNGTGYQACTAGQWTPTATVCPTGKTCTAGTINTNVCTVGTVNPQACTGWSYSAWGPCGTRVVGKTVRTATATPAGCTGTPAVTKENLEMNCICTADGQRRCNAGNSELCGPDWNSWVLYENCGTRGCTGYQCNASTTAPTPTPTSNFDGGCNNCSTTELGSCIGSPFNTKTPADSIRKEADCFCYKDSTATNIGNCTKYWVYRLGTCLRTNNYHATFEACDAFALSKGYGNCYRDQNACELIHKPVLPISSDCTVGTTIYKDGSTFCNERAVFQCAKGYILNSKTCDPGTVCNSNVNTAGITIAECKTPTSTTSCSTGVGTSIPQADFICQGNLRMQCSGGTLFQFQDCGTAGCANKACNAASTCSRKAEGDANCDGTVNELDLSIWINELKGITTGKTSDFDGNGLIQIADFSRWNATIIKGN